MLNRGFSLLEMLLALVLTSIIVISAMSFYPKFQMSIMRIYQQNRLEETTHQAITGLIKDIKRAGFIAGNPDNITQNAIEINPAKNCIILRYDAESTGKWRYNPQDPKTSDIFAYRYKNSNVEYQTGIIHCDGSGWEKLFDSAEVKITRLQFKQYNHYIAVELMVSLRAHSTITYHLIQYVKHENR